MVWSGFNRTLAEADSEIAEIVAAEEKRQNDFLQLIASENHTSAAVREATASVLTDKYAEGYPHKRYYGGCVNVDRAEELAIERAKKLFKCGHVNVQPHSGSQANMAVYFAALQPGDTIMGLDLSCGGHLTHGHKLSFSGKLYKPVTYSVSKETEQVDLAELSALAKKHKPKLIVCGASAYPRVVDFKGFREVADEVGAVLMADVAHIAGLIAAGEHPSPVGHAHYITTTTHKTLRGPRGAIVMCEEENAAAIDKAVFPGVQGGPCMNVIAAKAVCFAEAQAKEWKAYQKQIKVNAAAVAEEIKSKGFRLVSGGTDNHLMLVDVFEKGITGKAAEEALAEAGVTLNKNTIPFDTQKPFVASGIRVGTPCVTTRGMKQAEMKKIADLITTVLSSIDDAKVKSKVLDDVKTLCGKFPLHENG